MRRLVSDGERVQTNQIKGVLIMLVAALIANNLVPAQAPRICEVLVSSGQHSVAMAVNHNGLA